MRLEVEYRVIRYNLKDDGTFPNNDHLCALLYPGAIIKSEDELGAYMEHVFSNHRWENTWRNGILERHHYHSTAHEVLGIYAGQVKIQLGGEQGIVLDVQAGDVLVIPAGVAHKNLGSSTDFRCVGAYPEGQDYDMNYGAKGERPAADENIAQVALPETDPVYGMQGPLYFYWNIRKPEL